MVLKEKHKQTQEIYQGSILHVQKDTVTLPNGKEAQRELIRHIGAVCVVPLTADGQLVVERQYRYPPDELLTEIPAGKLDYIGEDPDSAILRELREETGMEAGSLIDMGYCLPAPAYSDEKIHMYLAKDLKPGVQALDEDEFLEVRTVPLKEIVDEILAGKIHDLKTQAAVLRAWMMENEFEK